MKLSAPFLNFSPAYVQAPLNCWQYSLIKAVKRVTAHVYPRLETQAVNVGHGDLRYFVVVCLTPHSQENFLLKELTILRNLTLASFETLQNMAEMSILPFLLLWDGVCSYPFSGWDFPNFFQSDVSNKPLFLSLSIASSKICFNWRTEIWIIKCTLLKALLLQKLVNHWESCTMSWNTPKIWKQTTTD